MLHGIHTHTHTHTHTHIHTHTHTHTQTHTHMHARMHTHTHTFHPHYRKRQREEEEQLAEKAKREKEWKTQWDVSGWAGFAHHRGVQTGVTQTDVFLQTAEYSFAYTHVTLSVYLCLSVCLFFVCVYIQSARNDRVDSWRSFQTKVKTKKVKTLKPPKLKQETRAAQ